VQKRQLVDVGNKTTTSSQNNLGIFLLKIIKIGLVFDNATADDTGVVVLTQCRSFKSYVEHLYALLFSYLFSFASYFSCVYLSNPSPENFCTDVMQFSFISFQLRLYYVHEIAGELSGASGSMVPRAATVHDDFDRQLLECMNDVSVANDYLYNPKINQFTLSFTKLFLEAEYRRNYTSESSDETQPTLALPRYSGLCDVVISCFFYLIVVLCCFVTFTVHTTWVIVCVIGVIIEAAILLPMIFNVCLSRPVSVIHKLSSWYPRHLFGVLVTSLPSVAAYSAFSCSMFDEVSGSDRFYCLLVITTLLHFCNFTMLSSWVKSPVATVTGIVLLILIGVSTCPEPQFVVPVLDNHSNATTVIPLHDVPFPEIFYGGEPLLWKLPILDIMLLLFLVWFLNREIEISYRLCYHGDVEAVSDRQKIQVSAQLDSFT